MGENRLMQDLYEENQKLKARVAELEAQHFSECAQIAHYDDELRRAKELLKAAVEDIYQDKCDTCTQEIDCKFCCCEGLYKWRYADEALALIGIEMINEYF